MLLTVVAQTFVDWLNSSEAALGLMIAVVGGLASTAFSLHQRRLAKRQRAADLFDSFYSPDNYHAMVAQVYELAL